MACDRQIQPRDTLANKRGAEWRPSTALESDARAVCGKVAAQWRTLRGAHVSTRDSTANPINRNSIQQNLPDEPLATVPACVVAISVDSGNTDSLPSYWPAAEWVDLWIISADGPATRMQTFQRGLVRCQVNSESDAGDPEDSVAVPSPWFTETTVCWRHPRAVVVSDTGRPPS